MKTLHAEIAHGQLRKAQVSIVRKLEMNVNILRAAMRQFSISFILPFGLADPSS